MAINEFCQRHLVRDEGRPVLLEHGLEVSGTTGSRAVMGRNEGHIRILSPLLCHYPTSEGAGTVDMSDQRLCRNRTLRLLLCSAIVVMHFLIASIVAARD